MYCHGPNIPAKYHDNRLDIFNVGSIFLSYAILPRLPLPTADLINNQLLFNIDAEMLTADQYFAQSK